MSRIDGALVKSMIRRSMPIPSPPAGGMPWSMASRNSSSSCFSFSAAGMGLFQLFHHAAALFFRIVEFGESVAEFPGVAIGLEAFDKARFARHFLGEGRDVLREVGDVARLDQRAFDLFFKDEARHSPQVQSFSTSKPAALAAARASSSVLIAQEVDAGCVLHGVRHGYALERALEGDLLVAEGEVGRAVDLQGKRLEQAFDEAHHVLIVGIGPVALHHGEFGIVPGGNAFIAEVAVDLEHLVGEAETSVRLRNSSGAMRRYMSSFSVL